MRAVLKPYAQSAAAEQAEAAVRHWIERCVIGLNLCPFAKAVHVRSQIRFAVTAAADADELLAEIEHEIDTLLAADPADLETTLLIHPLTMTDFIDYHFFVAEAEAALKRLGCKGVVQVVGFHPQYQFAGSEPGDMANYTNRSPHPILQLLREASVERVLATSADAAEIYAANIRRLRALGLEGWLKIVAPTPFPQ
jgi:uncharacterized protein